VIVVATTEDELAAVRSRLVELGAVPGEVAEAIPGRRLVLAAAEDQWAAERIVGALRAEGRLAVVRPDGGARLDAWREHSRPVEAGARLSIRVAWSEHEAMAADVVDVVELGLGGFGHGQHPTTRLLVEELIDRLQGGERVLDVGCGSGVLGLCALRLRASRVVAVDVKAEAIEATRRNAELNRVGDQVEATDASLAQLPGPFDVIVANVGRAAVVELAQDLVRLLAPDGWLAVSGLSPSQCELVAGHLDRLVERDRRTAGEWAALVLTRR
jgi:ribosomal protein L11 methyltransferase